jgi:hypothetical protein
VATKRNPTIGFDIKQINGIPFIVTTPTPNVRASKPDKDTVVWTIINKTFLDLEVAVVDFWPVPGTGAGNPTKGRIPGPIVVRRQKNGDTNALVCDGDPGTYKYSIVAKETTSKTWFSVYDPELDIDP